MSSTLYGLMANADAMAKALEELRKAMSDGSITLPVRYSDSIKLPYMTACIKEGFRIHPSVGLTMPRFVPSGGREILGNWFPEGTRVGCNAHVTHFDKEVFGQDADDFVPERWLKGDAANMDVSVAMRMMKADDADLLAEAHVTLWRRHEDMHREECEPLFAIRSCTCIELTIISQIALAEIHKLLPHLLLEFDLQLVNPGAPIVSNGQWFDKPQSIIAKARRRVSKVV